MTNPDESGRQAMVGDPAPDFLLPAVNREGEIGLASYKGRQAVLLGLFRGLHCPFCRRQVVQMNGYSDRLAELGTAGLAVINTELNRAQMYYGRLNMTMALAVDPDWVTHRRYGLSRPKMTLGKTDWPNKVNPKDLLSLRVNPTGELAKPVRLINANRAVNSIEGFKLTPADRRIQAQHGNTGAGFTLIDRDGIVRWRWLEGQTGFKDIAKFPTEQVILTAVADAQR